MTLKIQNKYELTTYPLSNNTTIKSHSTSNTSLLTVPQSHQNHIKRSISRDDVTTINHDSDSVSNLKRIHSDEEIDTYDSKDLKLHSPSFFERITTPFKLVSNPYAPWKLMKYKRALVSLSDAFGCDSHIDKIITDLKKNISKIAKLTAKTLSFLKTNRNLKTVVIKDHHGKKVRIVDWRSEYQDFILSLRESILVNNLTTTNTTCSQLIARCCWYRYNEVSMFAHAKDTVCKMIREGLDITSVDPWRVPLRKQFEAIKAAPNKITFYEELHEKMYTGTNVKLDPSSRYNIPYVNYDLLLDNKKIRCLRLGTPTIQRDNWEHFTWKGEAYIAPEFYTFLKYCQSQNKQLFWISLQDELERIGGNEHQRNCALKKLQQTFPKHFKMIILNHDSDFYYQKKDYKKLSESEKFKDVFFDHLISNKKGFYFPDNLNLQTSFKKILKALLNEVHSDYFNNKKDLSIDERRSFIDLFYTRLSLYFLQKNKPDLFCFCCKDSIDRAGVCNALLMKTLMIYNGQNTIKNRQKLQVYIHGPSLLVKKRAMNSRKERLIKAMEVLKNPVVKQRLTERTQKMSFKGKLTFL